METACHRVRLSITCVVELFIFRVGSQAGSSQHSFTKDVIVSLSLQVFSFKHMSQGFEDILD